MSTSAASSQDVSLEWTEERLPRAFARMHRELEIFSQASADAVMDAAGVAEGMTVLDVGCGSGVPALRMAVRVGPKGSVIATDPSQILIDATEAHASERGLTNIQTYCRSVNNLPVGDASMDAAVAHFSAMFFANVADGLRNIRRALKPGARVGVVGWGPDDQNEYFGTFFGAARPYMPLPPPDAPPPPVDPPRPNRFAETGRLSGELTAAGFKDAWESVEVIEARWDNTPEHSLATFSEIADFPNALEPDRRSAYDRAVLDALEPFRDGDGLRFNIAIAVGGGTA